MSHSTHVGFNEPRSFPAEFGSVWATESLKLFVIGFRPVFFIVSGFRAPL